MSRIHEIERREDLPEDQRLHYDFIEGPRGTVIGPFRVLLNSPDLAARIANVGTYLRFESPLDPAVRELAILTVSRSWDCPFEWAMHQPIAEREGTRSEAIAAIRDGTAPDGLTKQEALIYTYVTELILKKRASDATYEAVEDWLGRQGVTELTALAGYYSLLAITLNAFAVPPPTEAPLLPTAAY